MLYLEWGFWWASRTWPQHLRWFGPFVSGWCPRGSRGSENMPSECLIPIWTLSIQSLSGRTTALKGVSDSQWEFCTAPVPLCGAAVLMSSLRSSVVTVTMRMAYSALSMCQALFQTFEGIVTSYLIFGTTLWGRHDDDSCFIGGRNRGAEGSGDLPKLTWLVESGAWSRTQAVWLISSCP